MQLTIADLLSEIHDSHHPIAASLYYEEQRAEAARRAQDLRENRLPKYLGYFNRVLEKTGTGWLAGGQRSYADLSLFQTIAGLRYAYPEAMRKLEKKFGAVAKLHDRVAARANIAAYLESSRRIPFSREGIFRYYPELDE